MILEGYDEQVALWYQQQNNLDAVRAHTAIGLVNSRSELEGAVLLQMVNQWTANAHMHSIGPSLAPYTRGVFEWMFRHAFRVNAICPSTSMLKKHYPRLGFKFEAKLKDYYGPENHALQFSMTAPNCRWIKHHGLIAGNPGSQAEETAANVHQSGSPEGSLERLRDSEHRAHQPAN